MEVFGVKTLGAIFAQTKARHFLVMPGFRQYSVINCMKDVSRQCNLNAMFDGVSTKHRGDFMPVQKTISTLVLSVAFALLLSLLLPISNIAQTKVTTKKPSKTASQKSDIPDNVAYELFFRTLAENNAQGLLEKAGFNEEITERIFGEAKNLNNLLENYDKEARGLKESKTEITPEAQNRLGNLEQVKNEMISRSVNRYLLKNLSPEDADKFKDFIETEVKSKIQRVSLKPVMKDVAFIKTSNPRLQSGGNVYLYSEGWNDGANVFGTGTISENYSSNTSYQITVTVTSPSGRTNTTQNDWNYATNSNTTGLSIGIEDGTFSIQADFTAQDGYYDEYGNFIGTGTIFIGSSSTSYLLVPTISIRNFSVSRLTVGVGGELDVKATFSYTSDVPNGTTMRVELLLNTTGNIGITIDDPRGVSTGAGGGINTAPNSGNKIITVTAPNGGGTSPIREVVVTFPFNINSGSGTVSIDLIRDPPIVPGGGAVTVTPTQIPPVSFQVTATTSGGGSGGGGSYSQCDNGRSRIGGGFGTPVGSNGDCPFGSSQASGGICCYYVSPILLDIAGNGFSMTDYAGGVSFDVSAKGWTSQTSWTSANSDDAWLVLDRNQNNRVDDGKEMFGDATEQPANQNPRHGFAALAVFDKPANGGNNDGKITRRDTVFKKLRLWQDRNHNGISEAEELSKLPSLDVVAVFLNYQTSRRVDQYGNDFRYKAKIRDRNDAQVGRWAFDVFLLCSPPSN